MSWSGNPKFEHQQHRKFDPKLLLNLSLLFPNIQFYSFQRDNDLQAVTIHKQESTWDKTINNIYEHLKLLG